MPTPPISDLLDRDLAKAAIADQLERIDPLLRELVNHGTWVLRRCTVESSPERDVDLPVLTLYRHHLELVDGIHELMLASCAQAAVPLLRASFEAYLSLEFLLEDEAKYARRARAWMVAALDREAKEKKRHDPQTQAGREFRDVWTRDQGNVLELPEAMETASRTRLAQVEDLLRTPPMDAVWEAYKVSGRRHWFSIDNGPNNLRELAHRLERGVHYDLLYRQWSLTTHAAEKAAYVRRVGPGHAGFKALRGAERLSQGADFSASFLLATTRLLLGHFRPDEKLASWYSREIRPLRGALDEDRGRPSSDVRQARPAGRTEEE